MNIFALQGRRLLVALGIFVGCAVVVATVYRRAPINFLRAESGWFLREAHADDRTRQAFEAEFFTHSYNGHYTPLAFVAEARTARLLGTAGEWWRARQIIALSAVAAILVLAARSIGAAFGVAPLARTAIASLVASAAVFQPLMLEFIGWPCMVLQRVWLGLLISTLDALVKVATSTEKTRWAWVAALTAYTSMHATGLGLIAVAAVGSSLFAVLVVCRATSCSDFANHSRGITAAALTMLLLAAIHGSAMIGLPDLSGSKDHHAAVLWSGIPAMLGFVWHFVTAGARSLLSFSPTLPGSRTIAYCWPQGLLVLTGVVAAVACAAQRVRQAPTAQGITRLVLYAFSAGAFFGMLGLILMRAMHSPSTREMISHLALYTAVPRYLLLIPFLFIPVIVHFLVALSLRAERTAAITCFAFAIAAPVAQIGFADSAYRFVARAPSLNHSGVWASILVAVRDCRAADLPVPNFPLKALAVEFEEVMLSDFEPLLRRDLSLRSDEHITFAPWNDHLADGGSRHSQLPSVALAWKKLDLRARTPTPD
jgi:hypothetical protein